MIQLYKHGNYNFASNGDMILQPIEAKFRLELNGLWEISLVNNYDSKGRWKSININDVVKVSMPYGQDLFYIYDLDKDSSEGVIMKCKHIFFSLQKFYIKNTSDTKNLYDVRPTNCTGQKALELILAGTRFSGKSDVATLNTAYYIRKNVIQAILGDDENAFLNRWKGEVFLNNFLVTINKRIGNDYGVQCSYGNNSTNIKENINFENVITRAIPVMYEGLILPENFIDSPIINSYSEIYEGIIEFPDIKVKENIDDEEGFDTVEQACEEARKRVALMFEKEHIDKPTVTYEADMIPKENIFKGIKKQGYIVNLGDTVTVNHKVLGINLKTRVMIIEGDLLTGKYENIVFSNVYSKPSGFIDNQNRVDNIFNKETGDIIADKLGGFLDSTKTKIVATKGIAQKSQVRGIEYEDIDKNSQTYGSCMIGTQGIMVSQQRTLDGRDWDYTAALTAQGLVADKLYGNIFIGPNGYVDLANGEFQLGGNADDTVLITNKYGRWENKDGSFTQIDTDGICNVNGNTKIPYFYLRHMGEVKTTTSGHETKYINIHLPEIYKNKDFQFRAFIQSIETSLQPSTVSNQYLGIKTIDRTNALITVAVSATAFGYRLHTINGEYIWGLAYGGNSGGGGGGSTNNGDWQQGIPSSDSIRMLKGYEGYAPRIYSDSGGTKTIGYGTTPHDSNAWTELINNQPVGEEIAAKKMYDRIINNYGKPIINEIIQKFNVDSQQKFDALVDLVYNGGRDTLNLKHSLPRALSEQPNNESYIRPIWEKYWVSDGVKPQPGLIARRKAECDMYFKGIYEKRQILIINSNGGYDGHVTDNNGNGWLPTTSSESAADRKREAVVASAKKLVGRPYIWGGNYPPLGNSSGTDCSGLCQWAYNDNGIKISRTTYTQVNEGARITNKNDLLPGDLIFTRYSAPNTPEHVTLYAGNGYVVEAANSKVPIRYTNSWRWDGEARRIIQDSSRSIQPKGDFLNCEITIGWDVIA